MPPQAESWIASSLTLLAMTIIPDKDRSRPLRRLRQCGVALVLIFHFGIVFGNNEVHALVIQYPEKSSVTRNAVAIPISKLADDAELIVSESIKQNFIIADRGFCGHRKYVTLPTSKNDWFDTLRGGIQPGSNPLLVLVSAFCQISPECFNGGSIGPRIHNGDPNTPSVTFVDKWPLNISHDYLRSMGGDKFLPSKVNGALCGPHHSLGGLPQSESEDCDKDGGYRSGKIAIFVNDVTTASHVDRGTISAR